jgi:hypothetical protein
MRVIFRSTFSRWGLLHFIQTRGKDMQINYSIHIQPSRVLVFFRQQDIEL